MISIASRGLIAEGFTLGVKAGIILVSVSGFGRCGPYRDRPAFDSLGHRTAGVIA